MSGDFNPGRPGGRTQPHVGNSEVQPATPSSDSGKTGSLNPEPKLKLKPDQTSGKSLSERTSSKVNANPKLKPSSPVKTQESELKKKADNAVILCSLKHCLNNVSAALKDPSYTPPDGSMIMIELDNKWVKLVPPDMEGLKGHDVKQLLAEVKQGLEGFKDGMLPKLSLQQLEDNVSGTKLDLQKLWKQISDSTGTEVDLEKKWLEIATKPVSIELAVEGKDVKIQCISRAPIAPAPAPDSRQGKDRRVAFRR